MPFDNSPACGNLSASGLFLVTLDRGGSASANDPIFNFLGFFDYPATLAERLPKHETSSGTQYSCHIGMRLKKPGAGGSQAQHKASQTQKKESVVGLADLCLDIVVSMILLLQSVLTLHIAFRSVKRYYGSGATKEQSKGS